MKIKREKLKYINGDVQNGIVIDWAKVKKDFKALKVPMDVWTPLHIDYNKADWIVELSKRSKGKTTNNLLFGLLLYRRYGCDMAYIRTSDEELKLVFVKRMFKVILQCDYISEITDGEYNNVYYHSKNFYLCHTDDEGTRDKIDASPFMTVLSTSMTDDAKSTLNMPLCVWAIFDEFMKSETYRPNEFIDLCQLLSSIRRNRHIFKAILPSNLVDIYNPYIDELGIREELESLGNGQHLYIESEYGARLYLEWIEDLATVSDKNVFKEVKERERLTNIFFGFANKRLASIRGGGWDIKNYAHLPKREEDEQRHILYRDIYVYYRNKIICLELSYSNYLGFYVNAREYFGQPRENSIKFMLTDPGSPYEFYGIGLTSNKFHVKLWNYYVQHRFYYSNNSVGKVIESYIRDFRTNREYLRR